jgi:outer membrane immunogenic protein
MRSEIKLATALIASVVVLPAVSAQAQQFVAPIVTNQMYAPAPAASAWDGFYVGAQGAIVATKTHEINPSLPAEQLLGDIGGSAGVFAGYRYQIHDWLVLGIDGEVNNVATEYLYNATVYGAMKWDAAVRATLGYPVAPNVLAYGTVGYSWAHFDMSPFYGNAAANYTAGGFQFGLGVDMLITQNLMARLNATWTHYGVNNVPVAGGGTSEPSDVVVRVGLGWKF